MSAAYQCSYCRKHVPTLKGLRSHMTQRQACRYALRRAAERRQPQNRSGGTDSNDDGTPMEEIDEPQQLFEPASDVPMDPSGSFEPEPNNTSRRAYVEEVDDEESGGSARYVEDYLGNAGKTKGHSQNYFERWREAQRDKNFKPWVPFSDIEEWELAQWLIMNVGQNATDKFLKLPITRNRTKLSFKNKRAFYKCIDTLPHGAKWECEPFEITGDEKDEKGKPRTEVLHLWKRNPVECIKELIGNPAFRENLRYAPQKAYEDSAGENRIFDETWTGDWWWKLQDLLDDGATIAPVILASDKTQLSNFSGDKSAWPVYLTIGNIEKSIRRSPSARATILIGYIPVTKLECFSKSKRQFHGYQIFHDCMKSLLKPLVEAGNKGVDMICADGFIRAVFPILAAYIADHPEQCLVTCNNEKRCPRCLAESTRLGQPVYCENRRVDTVLEAMREAENGYTEEFTRQGLRPNHPFWEDLPHCDIFSCIMPDLLHQLHKGVFKDHIVKWVTKCLEGGSAEIDRRFRAMPRGNNLRHFRKGISMVSQWTGTEYKNMEKVFLGVLAGPAEPGLVRVVRATLDFIYYAHFESHTMDSLRELDKAWIMFHQNLHYFVDQHVRKDRNDFNIPKLHSMQHYIEAIMSRGSADGYSTESPERLHIDFAKSAYRATNKKNYIKQMTKWLERQESCFRFASYLQWAVPGYLSELKGESEVEDDEDEDKEGEGEEDDGEQENHLGYSVAKQPAHPSVSISTLINDYGAADFIPQLTQFLQSSPETSRSATAPIPTTRLPVYKCITVRLPPAPQVTKEITNDVIRARPALAARGLQTAVPAQFDAILARKSAAEDTVEHPLDGLTVGQVRVIFSLPEDYGSFSHPMAYIEWFTSFGNPVTDLGMYQVSRSTRSHRRHASIIPVDQIERSVHLIPKFGRVMDVTWSTEDVFELCKTFYVNPYFRHLDFLLFRYLLP